MNPLLPSPDESLDRLTADWHILQLKKGHRFSTDDLVTAWRASACMPKAKSLLDLGSGIGSVGMTTLWLVEDGATLVGIEAQDVSVALARRSAQINKIADRVEFLHGDLRDDGPLGQRKFELITGSPPYLELGTGILSPYPQRAACRHEMRGSIYDYCQTAAKHLAPGGRFCFVMPTKDPRISASIADAGFVVVERFAVRFRYQHKPLISTWVVARSEDGPFDDPVYGELIVRGKDGEWTEEYYGFRGVFGFSARPSGTQAPSSKV